ncbi:XRE family transcriptional regulator [Patescibacteria group bacterium]|nr:MAG: XRE family transcriptional regulator [Patescibacteria group bacterium]
MATPDSTTRRVAKRLKTLRLDRNLTQADIAEKAKMSTNYYAKIERGEVRPSVDIYERLAKALKVTASDIFPF